jgi:hypothetical protein
LSKNTRIQIGLHICSIGKLVVKRSTTEAHEYGHGLAQEHQDFGTDLQGQGQPPMGAARGTLVDPQYQWNPSPKPGEKWRTAIKRKKIRR